MDDLRSKIAKLIERTIRVRTMDINGVTTALVDDLNYAADAILALPEIADALQVKANLSDIISDAIRDVEDRA